MKAVFHTHTNYSHDGTMSPSDIIKLAQANNIELLAITDHNEIRGAQEAQRIAPFPVIVGEEIQTQEGGEIIGLFLNKLIPENISVFSAIEEIKRQGGIIYLPHPFDKIRTKQFTTKVLEKIAPLVDIVEVFNSRNIQESANTEALNFAIKYDKIKCVGADAHLPVELKGASVLFDLKINSPSGILDALRQAEFKEQNNPLWVHVVSKMFSLKRKMFDNF